MPSAISRSIVSLRRLCSGRARVMRATPASQRSFTYWNWSGPRFVACAENSSSLTGSIISRTPVDLFVFPKLSDAIGEPKSMLARRNVADRIKDEDGVQRVGGRSEAGGEVILGGSKQVTLSWTRAR